VRHADLDAQAHEPGSRLQSLDRITPKTIGPVKTQMGEAPVGSISQHLLVLGAPGGSASEYVPVLPVERGSGCVEQVLSDALALHGK
jgi:hypothetical protein